MCGPMGERFSYEYERDGGLTRLVVGLAFVRR